MTSKKLTCNARTVLDFRLQARGSEMKATVLRAGVALAIIAGAIAAAVVISRAVVGSRIVANSGASAPTIRIAEHRQPRIDALNKSVPRIEKQLGVIIEVVEYPSPEKDYLSKLLTELGAGNAPDLFTANFDSDVPDMVSAGYLAPITAEVKAWDGYDQLFDVAKKLSTSADGQIYVLDSMLLVEQIYFRRDLLDKAGISTAQPANWKDLLDRAREIKAKTGKYGLLLPAGISWGPGTFSEGFALFVPGSKTPQIANDDGTLNLNGEGVRDIFRLYKSLIDEDLMPIKPLLGPEPWVIPKYVMFPAGDLLATTCGTWCYIYDWGKDSKNPVPDVTKNVGTWAVPGTDGGSSVKISGSNIWAVNAKSAHLGLTKKVLLALCSVDATVAYAQVIGNIPARKDAADNKNFQALTELVPVFKNVDNGTFLKSAPGFSVVSEGVARATEALLRKQTDAAGAQAILVKYVKDLLGDNVVK
jgi:multiple sugar transport system substrate-binding protein